VNESRRDRSIQDTPFVYCQPGPKPAERVDRQAYMLDFYVPVDTPGGYVRAIFAMYGAPREAADAFFADVSSAICHGRADLLISEEYLVRNALSEAFSAFECAQAMKPLLEAELLGLLASGGSAA
jgi:hypothetical protein